jgi:hypothetical protein
VQARTSNLVQGQNLKYFDPFKILRAMDLAGGVCSYTAYDVIGSVVQSVDKADVSDEDDESAESTVPRKKRLGRAIASCQARVF